MTNVEIKRQSSDEANVSDRHVWYDIYVDGTFYTYREDIVEAMEVKEKLEAQD